MRVKYHCSYCKDFPCVPSIFDNIKECLEHEKACLNNPDNKTCYTCRNHGTENPNGGKTWNTCTKNLVPTNGYKYNFQKHCEGWEGY